MAARATLPMAANGDFLMAVDRKHWNPRIIKPNLTCPSTLNDRTYVSIYSASHDTERRYKYTQDDTSGIKT